MLKKIRTAINNFIFKLHSKEECDKADEMVEEYFNKQPRKKRKIIFQNRANEEIYLKAEIKEIKIIINNIPKENIIEKKSFEQRLETVIKKLEEYYDR